MLSSSDQLGRLLTLHSYPSRIISLVPSQTELLFDLGLEEMVIAITKFCVHPDEWFRTKTRIGGTKDLHLAKIFSLQPDLILANKEENVKEQIQVLAEKYPVWISDVIDLKSSLEMIVSVAKITNRVKRGQMIIETIRERFAELSRIVQKSKKPRTAYLIWKKPYMAAGGDTFIHSMLTRCGFTNIFENELRYPEATIEILTHASCELLLLASEPYPFKQKHVDELQMQLPDTRIMLVDGEMFSWYGSRLMHAPQYFANLRREVGDVL